MGGGLNAPANDEPQTDANSIIDNSSQSQRSASSRRQVGATSLGLLKLGDLDDLGYPYQHTPFRGYIGINIRGPSDTTHEKRLQLFGLVLSLAPLSSHLRFLEFHLRMAGFNIEICR